jgi:hypothetical protein
MIPSPRQEASESETAMFMTKTEVDAVQKYLSMREDAIALGSMTDSQDRDLFRQAREIAELVVRNARRREHEIDNLFYSLDTQARSQFKHEMDSGAYAKRMGYSDFWDAWFCWVK